MMVLKSISARLSLEVILVFVALAILQTTDSYYSVYLLLSLISIIAIYKNRARLNFKSLTSLFSCFFSLCITLANYQIFANIATTGGIWYLLAFLSALSVFIGSFIVSQNLLISLQSVAVKTLPTKLTTNTKLKFFLTCFAIFAILDLAILFLCFYPGVLTPDSIDEIGQLLSNTYSNHHPFYFTLLIKFFVSIGIDLFHDINIGVAMFSVFQILTLSAAFSYALLTLFEQGFSRRLLLVLACLLAIMPFNIMYSFTMWKDVLFGAAFLAFVVSIYRYFNFHSNHKAVLLIAIAICTIIICLFRSNALIAVFASIIIFFIIFKQSHLKLGLTLAGALFIAFILKTPVLNALNIPGPDNIESLSIPMQQVTRVLVEQKANLSAEDIDLISNLADPEALIDAYDPIIHDPVKTVVRLEGDKTYLSEHKLDFIGLYLHLGFQYPATYLKAWIDQTRGYWNSGYSYWRWSDEISANNYGISRTVNSDFINNAFHAYLDLFERTSFLQPLISIGLAVWILLAIFYRAIMNKDRLLIFISIPLIFTWGTLLIATPVFSEFRYVYFIFTCLPFITLISFNRKESRREKR